MNAVVVLGCWCCWWCWFRRRASLSEEEAFSSWPWVGNMAAMFLGVSERFPVPVNRDVVCVFSASFFLGGGCLFFSEASPQLLLTLH